MATVTHTRVKNYSAIRDKTPEQVPALAQESPDGTRVLLFFHCPFCRAAYQAEIPSRGGAWTVNRYFYRCKPTGGEFEVDLDTPGQ